MRPYISIEEKMEKPPLFRSLRDARDYVMNSDFLQWFDYDVSDKMAAFFLRHADGKKNGQWLLDRFIRSEM